jgi:hypothetical protein
VKSWPGSWLRSLPWWERLSLIGILLWTPTTIVIWSAVLALGSASGCSRAVLIPEGSPTRIGPDARSKVYYLDVSGEWKLSDNRVTLPEGWYLVPPSYVDQEK